MSIVEMKVPVIGESINEVTLSQWLKPDGSFVKLDEPICEFESDKATLEFPAEAEGKLIHVAKEGDDLAIGALVARIDTSVKATAEQPVASKPVEPTTPVPPPAPKKPEEVKALAEKWFGDIPRGERPARQLPAEPAQQQLNRLVQNSNVPVEALYLAFHMPGRLHPDYYAADLLSDVLCNGQSSRLFRRLLKEEQLFSSIDCYVTGSVDPGLLIIEGKPADGVSIETCRDAIWRELDLLRNERISEHELEKIKNKVESNLIFSEISILTKASTLAFYELLGDADMINTEGESYQRVSADDIQRMACNMLTRENCNELVYKPSEVTA